MILNWNDAWRFTKMTWETLVQTPVLENYETVELPHTWYIDGDYYQGDAVYQKVFYLELTEKQHAFVKFHGVDKVCKILLNGHMIGEHQGGYSIFTVEMTKYLKRDQQNILTVLVNNEKGETVCPLSGDFTIFGGIHREVQLIVTDEVYFDHTYYGTNGLILRTEVTQNKEGLIHVMPHVGGDIDETTTISYTFRDKEKITQAVQSGKADEKLVIPVDKPRLWEGKNDPYTYCLQAVLYTNGTERDRISLPVGFRTIHVDADEGFFLNGSHLKLNGVAKHQDTAGVFSAARIEHWEQDMELIEEIGANAVRFSHYQHPQQVYDICDEKGFVVWAEIPLLKLTRDSRLFENARQQLTELILQNMHHPSICFWGLQNEIAIFGEEAYMYERMKALQTLAKTLDPGRITTSANLNTVQNESPLNQITDTTAYNIYFGWYYGEMEDYDTFMDEFHAADPQRPLAISEYGVDCNLQFHSKEPKLKDYSEEFQALFHETVYPKMQKRPFIWGTFIWNMFDFVSGIRDEGGIKYRNNKGLVTHDRKTRKDSFYYYKALWSNEPFVHIAQKRFIKRNETQIDIKVYSNLNEVTIRINQQEYRQRSEQGIFCFKNIDLNRGTNTVEALAGSCTDKAEFIRTDEVEKDYIFIDPNPGINVRNWFTDEAEKARIFPEGSYSIVDTVNTLLANGEVMTVIDELLPNVGAYMRETIGSFTLDQAVSHKKTLCSETDIKTLNQRLVMIKKHD